MKYHIILSNKVDLKKITQEAQAKKRPRHVMEALRERLEAEVHVPKQDRGLLVDRIQANIMGLPAEKWGLARTLSSQVKSDDIIYCIGEDVGMPMAAIFGSQRRRPKVAVFIHNIDRPRGHFAMKSLGWSKSIDLFIAIARPQFNYVYHSLKIPEDRICLLPEQTDTLFFTPGPGVKNKQRPIIASVGLEKRDYRTLAQATCDLDVDVKIAGFSQDAKVLARTFPKSFPNNMSNRFYDFSELLQLYRDADIIVISLIDSKSGAGITAMLEAMACRKPVIVTQTQGLIDYLSDQDTVTIVKPGQPLQLRQAIVELLNNPQKAQQQAQLGYQRVLEQNNSEQFVEVIAKKLKELSEK